MVRGRRGWFAVCRRRWFAGRCGWFASPGCVILLVAARRLKGAFGVAFGDRTSSTLDTPHHDQGRTQLRPEPLGSTATIQGITSRGAARVVPGGWGPWFVERGALGFVECEDWVIDCKDRAVGNRLPTAQCPHSTQPGPEHPPAHVPRRSGRTSLRAVPAGATGRVTSGAPHRPCVGLPCTPPAPPVTIQHDPPPDLQNPPTPPRKPVTGQGSAKFCRSGWRGRTHSPAVGVLTPPYRACPTALAMGQAPQEEVSPHNAARPPSGPVESPDAAHATAPEPPGRSESNRCSSHVSADPRSCVLPWSTGCGSRVELVRARRAAKRP